MSTVQTYKKEFLTPDQYFDKQEVMKKVFNGYDEGNMFFAWLWRTRSKEHTSREDFHHYEMPTLLKPATVASKTGTAGAGNNVVITLSAADHEASGKSSGFPKKTLVKIVTVSLGEVDGYVVDKDTTTDSAHTITVQPLDATVDLVTAVAANDVIIDHSNAKGDGAGWVETTRRMPVKKVGKVQIFSQESEVFLGEASNMSKVVTESGKEYYYSQTEVDAFLKAQMHFGAQMVKGAYSESLVDPDEGNEVLISKSLDSYVKDEGFTKEYTTDVTLADFDALLDRMKIEGTPTQNVILPGDQLSRSIDKLFKGEFDNGSIDFGNRGIANHANKKVDFNFDGFRYGSFDFQKLKDVSEFSYKGTNYTDNVWRGTGFIIPADTMQDAKTGEDIPRLCMRYRKSDIENRFIKRVDRGPAEIGKDRRKIAHQMEAGLQGIGCNQMFKLKKA